MTEKEAQEARLKASKVLENRDIARQAQLDREKQRREAAVRNARIQYGGGSR